MPRKKSKEEIIDTSKVKADETLYIEPLEVKTLDLLNERIQKTKELINNKTLEIEKYQWQVKYTIAQMENQKAQLNSLLNEEKQRYYKYINQLTQKYNLPNRWGYDPDSGEIKIEE